MIPAHAALRGYRSTLACYAKEGIPDEWRGVTLRKFRRGPSLPPFRTFSIHARMILWLILNARRFSMAVIVHSSGITLALARVYRWLNPKGIFYFKTDLSSTYMERIRESARSRRTFRRIVELSSYTGVETGRMLAVAGDFLEEIGGDRRKLRMLPNGVSDLPTCESSPVRENRIIYVGHLGTEAKNSELLLSAFEAVAHRGWELLLVGGAADGYEIRLEQFIKAHPGRVRWLGPIHDREALFREYRKARVFCLSSRWESFSYALLEAACCGDYLVSTDVGVARDLLAAGAAGSICAPTSADMAKGLSEAMDMTVGEAQPGDNPEIIARYSWASILDPLLCGAEGQCA